MPSGLPLFKVFKDFVEDNNLKLTDINRLTDVFTYYSDAGTATSWIDHVVSSSTVDSMVSISSITTTLLALIISVLILVYCQLLHH